jgi:hypothetical protein
MRPKIFGFAICGLKKKVAFPPIIKSYKNIAPG